MTKSILTITTILILSFTAFSQNRSRVFDNFDTTRGVEVYSPTAAVEPAVRTNRTKTGEVRKAPRSNQKMDVRDGLGAKPLVTPTSYNKLTMGTSNGLRGFTTGDATVDSYIVEFSRRYAIDPLLIYAQMHQESSFKLRATSHKGASGLMQLMPGTARRFGVTNIYDAKQNVEAGIKYMRWLLDTFRGDVALALAGYNAGEGAVWKYNNQIPPYRETQEYVRRISARYNTISNPSYVRAVKNVSPAQAAKLEQREAKPLTVLDNNALTIRLPDGRLRLVN